MIFFSFLLSLLAWILQGTLLPRIPLFAFAPFLALGMIRRPFPKALGLSLLAGCFVDLLSDDPMGLHALNYVLTTALLYRFRNNFSYDEPLHLSLYTTLLSALSTGLQLLLLFLFDRKVPIAGKWFLFDLIGMPLADGLYAFIWFCGPLALFEKVKRGWILFLLERKQIKT
jgi:rod shape-determining protein MreD